MRSTAILSVWAVLKTQTRSLAGAVMALPAAQEINGSLAFWVISRAVMEVWVRLGPMTVRQFLSWASLVAWSRALVTSPSSS